MSIAILKIAQRHFLETARRGFRKPATLHHPSLLIDEAPTGALPLSGCLGLWRHTIMRHFQPTRSHMIISVYTVSRKYVRRLTKRVLSR